MTNGVNDESYETDISSLVGGRCVVIGVAGLALLLQEERRKGLI